MVDFKEFEGCTLIDGGIYVLYVKCNFKSKYKVESFSCPY